MENLIQWYMHSTQNQQEQSLVKCARPHWWPCRGRCKSNNGLCVSCPAAGSRISPAAVQHMQYAQQGICSGRRYLTLKFLGCPDMIYAVALGITYDVHTEIGVWNSRERYIRDMTKWKERKVKLSIDFCPIVGICPLYTYTALLDSIFKIPPCIWNPSPSPLLAKKDVLGRV